MMTETRLFENNKIKNKLESNLQSTIDKKSITKFRLDLPKIDFRIAQDKQGQGEEKSPITERQS